MITAVLPQTTDPIPAVLPSVLSPLPRIRGNPVVPITVQLTSFMPAGDSQHISGLFSLPLQLLSLLLQSHNICNLHTVAENAGPEMVW